MGTRLNMSLSDVVASDNDNQIEVNSMRGLIHTGLLLAILLFISACSGEEGGFYSDNGAVDDGTGNGDNNAPQTIISKNGDSRSHTDGRQGSNCMNCHYEGNNRFVYVVAGTVYQLDDLTAPYPDATITFYSEPAGAGTVRATIEADANGNFYTTEPVDFSAGVYPVITGNAGEAPLHMGNFITHGECNSCHGTTTSPLYVGEVIVDVVERVSANGLTVSHTDERRGSDCSTCHESYSVSGSVYDLGLENNYANATLYLYDGPDSTGQLVETLEADANGNFYSTDVIDFSAGLYPVIASEDGTDRQHMSSLTTSGACNSCHGISAIPIYSGEKVNLLVSQNGTTTSHTDERRGQNCMNCHALGTGNPLIYTIAGSVYQQADPTQNYANATINFYSQPGGNGNLVATIEVDANGNFFTTEDLGLEAGLYPSIVGNGDDDPLYMPSSTTNGECNSCHGDGAVAPIVVAGEVVQLVSANGTSFSHTDGRRGVDCLGCHNIGGSNQYQYSVAGSVFEIDLQNFYADGKIDLYRGPGGTDDFVATIEIDSNGNFYSTAAINIDKGKANEVYPSVTGRDATSQTFYMNSSVKYGGCNSCHGSTRLPVYAQ